MCAQQINSSQSRVNTTYLIQQQINIDGEIDVKKRKVAFKVLSHFLNNRKLQVIFLGQNLLWTK